MDAESAPNPAPSVFISYASEDRAAARRLRDAIASHGIEIWFDESGLTGGETWDRTIRERIRSCDLFLPVISRTTGNRANGP